MKTELKNFDNITYNTEVSIYTVSPDLVGKEVWLKELYIYENNLPSVGQTYKTKYLAYIKDINNQVFYLTSMNNDLTFGSFDKLINCPIPLTVGDTIIVKKTQDSGNISVSVNINYED